jgi:hypothetical protein
VVWCLLVNTRIFVLSIEHSSAPTNVCSQLQLASSEMRHGVVHFIATCMTPTTNADLRKRRRKFRDERVPSIKKFSLLTELK